MRLVLAAALALIATPALAQTVELAIDEARPIRLSTPITGVVVGNAGVADIIVHDANMLFVLGKSVGTTSVVAVDALGRTVYSSTVSVTAPDQPGVVMVQRGARSTSALQCTERCVTVVAPAAGAEANAAAAQSATARTTFARGSGGGGN